MAESLAECVRACVSHTDGRGLDLWWYCGSLTQPPHVCRMSDPGLGGPPCDSNRHGRGPRAGVTHWGITQCVTRPPLLSEPTAWSPPNQLAEHL